jgi:UDP-galactopyranose mutase
MAIDEYFSEEFGPLPYRSIRFHHRAEPLDYSRGTAPVINFTDDSPYTRETDWSLLPKHDDGLVRKTITREQPCDYRDNEMERYYPVKTSDGRNDVIYRRYKDRAETEAKMTFIGRCGTYQYLDMDQVINQSLTRALAWLESNP